MVRSVDSGTTGRELAMKLYNPKSFRGAARFKIAAIVAAIVVLSTVSAIFAETTSQTGSVDGYGWKTTSTIGSDGGADWWASTRVESLSSEQMYLGVAFAGSEWCTLIYYETPFSDSFSSSNVTSLQLNDGNEYDHATCVFTEIVLIEGWGQAIHGIESEIHDDVDLNRVL